MNPANSTRWAYRRIRWSAFWRGFQLPEISISDLVGEKGAVTPPFTDKLCLPPYYGPVDHDDANSFAGTSSADRPTGCTRVRDCSWQYYGQYMRLSKAHVYTVNALPEQIKGALISFVLKKDEIGETYRSHGFLKG